MNENKEYPREEEFLGNIDDEPKVTYGNNLNIQVGSEIRRLRQGKGFSQAQLGELLNKPKGNVSKLENGKFNPSIEYLSKVANALEMKLQIRFE